MHTTKFNRFLGVFSYEGVNHKIVRQDIDAFYEYILAGSPIKTDILQLVKSVSLWHLDGPCLSIRLSESMKKLTKVVLGPEIENSLGLKMFRTSHDDIYIKVPKENYFFSLTSLYSIYMNSLGFWTADLLKFMSYALRTRVGQVDSRLEEYVPFCNMMAIIGDLLQVPKSDMDIHGGHAVIVYGFGSQKNYGVYGECRPFQEIMTVPVFVSENPQKYLGRADYRIISAFIGDELEGLLKYMNQNQVRMLESEWAKLENDKYIEASSHWNLSYTEDEECPDYLSMMVSEDSIDEVDLVIETKDDLLDPTCGTLEREVVANVRRMEIEPCFTDEFSNLSKDALKIETDTSPVYEAPPEYNVVAKALLEPSQQINYVDYIKQNGVYTQIGCLDADLIEDTKDVDWVIFGSLRVRDLVKVTKSKVRGWMKRKTYQATGDFSQSFYVGDYSIRDWCFRHNRKFNLIMNPYSKVREKLMNHDCKLIFPVSWGLPPRKKLKEGPSFLPRFEDNTGKKIDYKEGIGWEGLCKAYIRSLWSEYGEIVVIIGPYSVYVG
jgi:hypothetical protein